jgi:hypothetical protein
MKNDAFHILRYVNLYLYMDPMEFEINTIQYMRHFSSGLNHLANCHETQYDCHVIRSHPKVILFNFLEVEAHS